MYRYLQKVGNKQKNIVKIVKIPIWILLNVGSGSLCHQAKIVIKNLDAYQGYCFVASL
jgi:hypothetical protein